MDTTAPTARTCRKCQATIVPTGRRGRPRVICETCKPKPSGVVA